jgi:hypothetical protein
MRLTLLFTIILVSLTACKEGEAEIVNEDHLIVKVELEADELKNTLYIPKKDFHQMAPHVEGDDSVLLRVMYPNMTPLLEEGMEIWKRGESYKLISILLSQSSRPLSNEEFAEFHLDHFGATEFVGEEYGLLHYTQPKSGIRDNEDVWVEKDDDEILSVIICGEKILETNTPQCSHFIRKSKLSIRFRFDKRLLSKWKTTKDQIFELLKSYESISTAESYFNKRHQLAEDLLEGR